MSGASPRHREFAVELAAALGIRFRTGSRFTSRGRSAIAWYICLSPGPTPETPDDVIIRYDGSRARAPAHDHVSVSDRFTPRTAARRALELLLQRRGVNIPVTAKYAVRLRDGGLEDVGRTARDISRHGQVVVVADASLPGAYLRTVRASLARARVKHGLVLLPTGERAKQPETAFRLWRELAKRGFTRDDLLIAVGGGATSDVAGFSAAMYAEGLDWMVVPTTLLAMADAAIGGKTGLNLSVGKNLVGAFHDPCAVLADVSVLRTLHQRELASGLAEITKTAFLSDHTLVEQLEASASGLGSATHLPQLFALLVSVIGVKARFVTADPFDTGERMLLNFGHTFGHALEASTGFRQFAHGEAVALGMVFATALADDLGLVEASFRGRLERVLVRLGLPIRTRVPAAVWTHIRHDKKRGSTLRWILPRRIGAFRIVEDVPQAALRRAERVLERLI